MASPAHHRLVVAGLAAVLVALVAFALASAMRIGRATDRVEASAKLADAYGRARSAVGEEEALKLRYRATPGAAIRAQYDRTAGELVLALRAVAQTGTAGDQALVQRLLGVHARYLVSIAELFDAVDAGRSVRATTIDATQVDPRFGTIDAQIRRAAERYRATGIRDLRDLRDTQRSVMTITPIVSAVGLLLLAFVTVLLVRINRRLARQAATSEHDALHDALTGLPNRVLFGQHLDRVLAEAARGGWSFSILMLDLDRFKEVNDTLGHSVGDEVLRDIGPRLSPLLGPGEVLARLSGDEFAIVLPGAGTARAREVTHRVLAAVREPFALGKLSISVDVSVGIVTYPLHGDDAETLVQRADVAMYMAKERGRGQALYDPAEDPYDPERLMLVGELRTAIDGGQLELHYQPKFAAGDLRPAGVEALVRWRHPTRGLLPPSEFISMAEHTGLIRELTVEVLRKAARQWRAWQREGIDLAIAVNLSVANLLDGQLVDDLPRILREEGMPSSRLALEITEGTFMSDPQRVVALLERFAAMEIQLSIDDYGTGYSSLSYLRRLPVCELKIDRAFVRDLADNAQDIQIVHSTIELGHSLGLRVVAEGIEDERSLSLLRAQGCDVLQGFYLGRPEAADVLIEHLRHGGGGAGAVLASAR